MENKPKRSNGFMDILKHTGSEFFRWLSKLIDHILFDKTMSVLFSLFMAIIICFTIDYENISIRLLNDTTTSVNLAAVEVEILADTDTYEIGGVPNTVDVVLQGDATDIQVFRQQGNFKVIADLRKYKEGNNVVDLKMESLPSNITAKINPGNVTAVLSKKETVRFPLEPQLLVGANQKISDFETPELLTEYVDITASQQKLASIRVVKAIVDATGQTADFETTAKLVAYDSDGNAVFVVIVPETVQAIVKLAN